MDVAAYHRRYRLSGASCVQSHKRSESLLGAATHTYTHKNDNYKPGTTVALDLAEFEPFWQEGRRWPRGSHWRGR